jgi:HAD domain in Swiss Army Knife RNA repair proteins
VILDPADPRPVLLVDVDGVLNPWEAEGCPDGYQEYDFYPAERVLLSPGHGELLTSLAPAYELVWATAWEHRANRLIGPVLALPELPVIEFPLSGRDLFFRKLPAVIDAVGDRPCAWIDDAHQPDHYAWARQRAAPTLLIDIDPSVGLTRDVIATLRAWAAGLAEGAQP